MANQISVNTGTGNQQVTVTSTGNIQVTTSRSVIGTVANVQSANYANYAGNAFNVSGSNVTGPVANATNANTAGTVTTAAQPNITSLGTITGLTSTGNITAPFFIGNVVGNISGNIVVPGSNQAVLYNNSGNAGASDAFKFNQASNVVTVIGNVVANYFIGNGSQLTGITATDANTANYANFAGNAFSVAGANVSGAVAFATTANAVAGANVSGQVGFAAVANSVAGANVSGTVANATYAISAGTANSATVAASANSVAGANVTGTVANATFATTAGSATTAGTVTTNAQPNITSTGTLTGLSVNGNATVTNMTVTGNLSVGNLFANNANYANFAGDVVNSAQPNITSLGNLPYLQISNSANSDGVIRQTSSGNITFTNNGSNTETYQLTTQYHPNNSVGYPGDRYIRSRGNVTTPTTAVTGDRILARSGYAYNGTTNALSVTETWTALGTVNSNTSAQWTGGQWNLVTGNPGGNSANQNSLTFQNQLVFTNSGSLQINPGGPANTSLGQSTPSLLITNYGADSTNLTGVGGQNQQRARGNRDALLSVEPNDSVGRVNMWGYNGTQYQSGRPAAIIAQVDSSYVANATVIPLNMTIRTVNSSNNNVDTVFYGNGTASFPGNITANYYVGNGSSLTNITGANVTGEVAYAAVANSVAVANISGIGNIATVNLDGNASNILYGNGAFSALPTVSNVANANYANFAGTVITNAQPNITSVGTLTSLDVSGNATIGNITNVDSVTFDTANAPATVSVAQLSWNDGQGTLDLGLKGGNVTATVAQQQYARVYNAEANTLSKGEIVYVYGAQGNLISVKRALADGDANSAGTLGMVAESITSGGEGFVQASGAIYKLNTNGLTAGGAIYLSPTTPGAYTQTKPVAPDHTVILGWVERVSTTVGSIYLKVDNGYELDELHNVLITSPVAGQALVYNSSNLWVNGNPDLANYATVANSVALSNVSGAGNIASINLDGNASNVLLGNGVFSSVPSSSILANGTSNVSIPASGGNVNISANGVANIVSVLANGVTFVTPPTNVNGALTIDSYGNPLGDVHRINSRRARGNATTPLSVNPNDATMRLLTFGHNGTAYQLNSTGSIRASVDSSYTANGANIPIGWAISVNDTNGGINNQTKTHNFWANGNVTFLQAVSASNFSGDGSALSNIAVANVTGLGNIATLNLDGNASNVLLGNGVFSSVPSTTPTTIANGTSNVSIPVANGNVNISTNNNANIAQFDTNGALFLYPTTSSINALRINSYGNPTAGDVSRIASFRARGTASSPLSVQPNDALMRLLAFGHNGTIQQTGSTGSIRAVVDSSYTANGANIPVGWQVLVNDTNGGVNNQTRTHNFYANGFVNFASNVTYSGTLNLSKFNETTSFLGNVSGTITPDLNTGSIISMILTGNITLNSLANVVTGASATLKLIQDGTGNRTLSSTMKFASGFKTLSTAPNSIDVISVFYDGSDYLATLTTGYQ